MGYETMFRLKLPETSQTKVPQPVGLNKEGQTNLY